MKILPKWTGTLDHGERRFKGWSDEGHKKAYETWTMEIKKGVREGLYIMWEKAF